MLRGKEKTGKQRDPVPRVVFSKRPACFHAYLLALNFAFAGGHNDHVVAREVAQSHHAVPEARLLGCHGSSRSFGLVCGSGELRTCELSYESGGKSFWTSIEFTGNIEENER